MKHIDYKTFNSIQAIGLSPKEDRYNYLQEKVGKVVSCILYFYNQRTGKGRCFGQLSFHILFIFWTTFLSHFIHILDNFLFTFYSYFGQLSFHILFIFWTTFFQRQDISQIIGSKIKHRKVIKIKENVSQRYNIEIAKSKIEHLINNKSKIEHTQRFHF